MYASLVVIIPFPAQMAAHFPACSFLHILFLLAWRNNSKPRLFRDAWEWSPMTVCIWASYSDSLFGILFIHSKQMGETLQRRSDLWPRSEKNFFSPLHFRFRNHRSWRLETPVCCNPA